MLYMAGWAKHFFAAVHQHPHICGQIVCMKVFSRLLYTLKNSFLGTFYFKKGFPDLIKNLVPIFMHSAALVFMWQLIF